MCVTFLSFSLSCFQISVTGKITNNATWEITPQEILTYDFFWSTQGMQISHCRDSHSPRVQNQMLLGQRIDCGAFFNICNGIQRWKFLTIQNRWEDDYGVVWCLHCSSGGRDFINGASNRRKQQICTLRCCMNLLVWKLKKQHITDRLIVYMPKAQLRVDRSEII